MIDFTVKGKIAFVSGGGRGLGLTATKALLENGAAKVYISSRNAAACAQAVKDLNSMPGISGTVISIPADFTKLDQIKNVFGQISSENNGRLDIVIANAGATWGSQIDSHPPEAFDRVFNLNLKGVFLTIQQALPLLEKSGSATDPSRVLIIGSITGIMTASGGGGGTYGYSISKAAVHHLTRLLSVELGPRNITVNAIAPGFFPSKMADGLISAVGKDNLSEANPRGRLGEPEDLESLTVFLCSKASSYINGTIIPLDGGFHLVSKL
ncbi:uncharacterized protein V1516DRAFT_672124 [Lipomyces oligophaga]|uniref:uncharacterized protein n=1 Tax=Lipomyces oligophaga TaxID=45792 RepID=UPI0034CDE3DA